MYTLSIPIEGVYYMNIGKKIKQLRIQHHITQQEFSESLGVSVQTISRWENEVNCPDIVMLPIIASYFHVSTDFLLGMKGENKMAKLMKTKEEFEVGSKEEAKKIIENFKKADFPKLISYEVIERDYKIILVVEKEFGVEFDKMKF